MSEFVMEGRAHAARRLDQFTLGYVEALFFTETATGISSGDWNDPETQSDIEEGRIGGSFPEDCDFDNLDAESLERIKADCQRFQSENAELLNAAYALEPGSDSFRYASRPIDPHGAGMLFFFTRHGHGVGWSDNGQAECLGELDGKAGWRTKFEETFFSYDEESGKVFVS